MHNLEFVVENETCEILWDFGIQTDHLTSARRPDLVIVDFTEPADHKVKLKESEKRDKYLNLAREQKKTMGHEDDGDTNCIWCIRNDPQRID